MKEHGLATQSYDLPGPPIETRVQALLSSLVSSATSGGRKRAVTVLV
jgi:hypothetical protein